MKSKQTQHRGLQTVPALIPRRLADWAKAQARAEGHGDLSRVVRAGLDRLIARQQAGEIL